MRLAIALLVLLALALPAFAQSRVALVVGNGAYRHVEQLPNPVNDARAMAGALRDVGFQVELLADADKAALEAAIRRFGARAEGAEAALFFYAGHAIEVGGQNMLAPVAAQVRSERDLPFELIPLDLLMSQAEGRARVLLVFLDACRDNPFRAALGASGRGSAARGLAALQSTATGTLIAFATAPGNVALDGRGANSPFTTALVRYIATPGLEVRSMLGRVRQAVRLETGGRQLPWDSSSLEGEFFFRPGTMTAEPVVPTTPAPAPAAPAPPAASAPTPPAPARGPAAPPPAVAAAPAVPGPSPAPAPRPPARPQQQAARTAGGGLLPGCPPAGMRSTTRLGYPMIWRGTDPADATVCLVEDSTGRSRRLLLGIWSAGDPNARGLARQLQAMFPPDPTRQVTIRREVGMVPVDETWTWLGAAEAAAIPGVAGRGTVLQRRIRIRADQPYEAIRSYAIDPATGAVAAIAFRHLHGQPYMGSWPSSASLTDGLIEDAVER